MELDNWINTEIGKDIWTKKYKYENEAFSDWLDRVSNKNDDYKKLIIQKKFLPAGRILANRGLGKCGKKVTYSNCYTTTPPSDNLESIFETAKNIARTFSYGGGIGIDISNLRPNQAAVNNAAKKSSGAVSFMELYSMVTGLISQKGRRGALILTIDCNHPDIEEFIDIKKDLNKVTKANISIKISDEFMQSIRNDDDFILKFIVEATGEEINKKVNAKKLFRKIAKNNWEMGDPAMLFWDTFNRWCLTSEDENFAYVGVNPCGEQPLPAGGSCLLGSINLSVFVQGYNFNYQEFEKTIRLAVRYLNELLIEGMELHPLEEQKESVNNWRQIGLGIMGLADMFIKMNIRYGSKESLDLVDKIGFLMADTAIQESALIAKENGAYPMYSDVVLDSPFFIQNTSSETKFLVKEYGLANSQILTCAPTGTLSTMLGISGGIEPIYAYSYSRKTESLHNDDKYYKIYTPIVKEYMEKHNIKTESDLPEFFTNAMLLKYEDRIAMQSVWQRHIDASISSTVNLPESASIEDVENIYMLAWENGLKGITVFRNNCKRTGVLTQKSEIQDNYHMGNLPWGTVIEQSDDLIGKKKKITTGCGSLHCLAYFSPVEGNLTEVYFSKGSRGGCQNFMVGLSRIVSLAARGGIKLEAIADQLLSCGTCPSYATRKATIHDTSKGSSCPVAIAYALEEMQKEMYDELGIEQEPNKFSVDKKYNCPECGENMISQNGCITCNHCGWSKCD